MNFPGLPRASLGSDSPWLSANFDDFQSPTGTTTGTKIQDQPAVVKECTTEWYCDRVLQRQPLSASDVFQTYATKRVPDDRDFAAIRVRVLAAATRLVNWLAAHVPVRGAVNAPAVFTNPDGDWARSVL